METDATENKSYAHISEQLSGRDSCLKKSFQCKNLLSTKNPANFRGNCLDLLQFYLKPWPSPKPFLDWRSLKESICLHR